MSLDSPELNNSKSSRLSEQMEKERRSENIVLMEMFTYFSIA